MSTMIKLESMIDKTYYYRKQKAVIKSYDNSIGEFELIIEIEGTPKRFIKTTEEKLELFLANFSEVQQVEDEPEEKEEVKHLPAPRQNEEMELYTENKAVFSNLSQVLLNDIEKVKTDPAYVKQAKQISNSVNALVNLTKLQLQLIKSR